MGLFVCFSFSSFNKVRSKHLCKTHSFLGNISDENVLQSVTFDLLPNVLVRETSFCFVLFFFFCGRVLERIGARALVAHVRTFADFLVYEFSTSAGGQQLNKCIEILNDMVWKYNIVTLDRLILCLVSLKRKDLRGSFCLEFGPCYLCYFCESNFF